MLASTNMIPHTAKGKTTKPTDLWSFHWDEKPVKPNKLSSSEIQYIEAKRKLQRDGSK